MGATEVPVCVVVVVVVVVVVLASSWWLASFCILSLEAMLVDMRRKCLGEGKDGPMKGEKD